MLVLSSSTDTADTDQLPQSEASFSGPDTSPGHWELERKLAGSEEVEYENWTGDIRLSVGGWGLTVPSLVVMACSQACILPSYVRAREETSLNYFFNCSEIKGILERIWPGLEKSEAPHGG